MIQCWGLTNEGFLILLEQDRGRMEGPDQLPAIKRMFRRTGAGVVFIEAVAYQYSLIQHARRSGLPAWASLSEPGSRTSASS